MGAFREFINDVFGNGGGLRATFANMLELDKASNNELLLTPKLEVAEEDTTRCRAGFEDLHNKLTSPNNDGGPA